MIRAVQNLLKDPMVLVSAGVLIFGLIALFWALARLLPGKKSAGDFAADPLLSEPPPADDLGRTGGDDLLMRDPLAPPPRPEPARFSSGGAAGNASVNERLDVMAQRLAEMQNVLTKQAVPAGGGAAGNIGQGFSPETVDKLLKIIGNVTQQVDILQKALNVKDGSAPK